MASPETVFAAVAAAAAAGFALREPLAARQAAGMRYFKLLANHGHRLDAAPGAGPGELFLGMLPRRLGWLEPVPPWFRFAVLVRGGEASFWLGAPGGASREAAVLFRRAFPAVDPIPQEGPPPFPWDAPDARALQFRLERPSPLPLAMDRGAAPLEAVLSALGAGRSFEGAALFEALFAPEDAHRRLVVPGRRTDAALVEAAMVPPKDPLAGLDGLKEEIEGVLFGGKRISAGGPREDRSYRAVFRAQHRPETALAEAVRRKYTAPQRAWRVAVRVAAAGMPDAAAALRAAASALENGLAWHNRLVPALSPHQRGLLKRVARGVMLPGEGVILCTSELAQLVLVPGEESPLWARGMERAAARTLAPPPEMTEEIEF